MYRNVLWTRKSPPAWGWVDNVIFGWTYPLIRQSILYKLLVGNRDQNKHVLQSKLALSLYDVGQNTDAGKYCITSTCDTLSIPWSQISVFLWKRAGWTDFPADLTCKTHNSIIACGGAYQMNEGEVNGSYLTCDWEEETQRRTKRQAVQSSTERKDFNEADLSPSFK